MRESVMTKFEKSTSGENGSRLESEFLGEVNKAKYKDIAYNFLHKDELKKADTPEKKFEAMLKMKERAAQMGFEDIIKGGYIDLNNAIKLVEQSQIGNPEKPSRFFSGALLNHLKERFAEKYIIKFFTATGGTHLDVLHGIDGFFKLYDKESGDELAMSTIDITKNSSKDRAKADVIIYIDGSDVEKYDPSKNNKEFDKKFFETQIEKFSEMIVESLVDNYQKNS